MECPQNSEMQESVLFTGLLDPQNANEFVSVGLIGEDNVAPLDDADFGSPRGASLTLAMFPVEKFLPITRCPGIVRLSAIALVDPPGYSAARPLFFSFHFSHVARR
jgi:hypothetical protein